MNYGLQRDFVSWAPWVLSSVRIALVLIRRFYFVQIMTMLSAAYQLNYHPDIH